MATLGASKWLATALLIASLTSGVVADGNGVFPCMTKGQPDQSVCDLIKLPTFIGSKCLQKPGASSWFCTLPEIAEHKSCAGRTKDCMAPLICDKTSMICMHPPPPPTPPPVKEGGSCAANHQSCEKPLVCNEKTKICMHPPPPPTPPPVKEGGSCAANHQSCEKPLVCNEKTKICMHPPPPPTPPPVKEGGSCAANHQSCEKPLVCNEKTKICMKAPRVHSMVKEGGSCALEHQRCNRGLVCHKKNKVCTRGSARPKPSQKHRRDIHFAGRGATCPETHQACAVAGLKTGYECIDTSTNLEQCGGCAADAENEGVDCTAAVGAESVACVAGRCEILSCATGFAYNSHVKKCQKEA